MKISGQDVLYALRDAERETRVNATLLGIPSRAIARRLGGRDGRVVTQKLARLEGTGLVLRVYPSRPRWATTERGREVELLLSGIDADRGGSFRPRHDVIHDLHERLALAL